MADKKFIGRVYKDKWENPELNLTADDLDELKENLSDGKVKILIKKSQTKGTFYAEIKPAQA
jgi:hypothetical protein